MQRVGFRTWIGQGKSVINSLIEYPKCLHCRRVRVKDFDFCVVWSHVDNMRMDFSILALFLTSHKRSIILCYNSMFFTYDKRSTIPKFMDQGFWKSFCFIYYFCNKKIPL